VGDVELEDGPDEGEAAGLAGEAADHLGAVFHRGERPSEQVRGAPPAAVSGRVVQVHDERVEVVREALRRGGVAGAVELVDQRLESLLSVPLVGGVVERQPAGGADAFALTLGQLGEQLPYVDQLLAVGVGENPRESLSELARLGARLIIQRAVEDEFDAWLGRARYERRPDHQRGLCNYGGGLRNGFRPRTVQTAEGELEIEIPQVREAAETFASKLFPRGTKLVRTEPLKALVIGAFVRGLSMRDVESLCEKAGLGKLSRSTAWRVCEERRERFEQFKRRDLYDIRLVALSLDATYLAVRPDGPKEGVLVAWGFTEDGERVMLSGMLGMRESYEDWLSLGRV
jgi:hypothetical protein